MKYTVSNRLGGADLQPITTTMHNVQNICYFNNALIFTLFFVTFIFVPSPLIKMLCHVSSNCRSIDLRLRENITQTVLQNSIFIINRHLVQHVSASATAVFRYYHLQTPWGKIPFFRHQIENKRRSHTLETAFRLKCRVSKMIRIVKYPNLYNMFC
jgi:hypothetical protein